MPVVTVGSRSFPSKKVLEEFEQSTMASISFTESLKASTSSDIFAFYFDLVHRHPDAPRKLAAGIADFKVVPTERDPRAKELQIIHTDGTCSSISRKTCISQRTETSHGLLRAAMRTAIEDQIDQFRTLHSECQRCGEGAISGDVDHILPFEQLASNFCQHRADIPTEFTKKYGTNQHCFTAASVAFSTEWQHYHRENATLRLLCKPCHMSRSAWETKT